MLHIALAALTGLTNLYVDGECVTGGYLAQETQTVWAWLEGVGQLQGLRKLTLRNMDRQYKDGAGNSALANALSQLHSLEEFHSTAFNVQEVIAVALASLTRLTSLTTWGLELTGQHPLHGLKQLCYFGVPL